MEYTVEYTFVYTMKHIYFTSSKHTPKQSHGALSAARPASGSDPGSHNLSMRAIRANTTTFEKSNSQSKGITITSPSSTSNPQLISNEESQEDFLSAELDEVDIEETYRRLLKEALERLKTDKVNEMKVNSVLLSSLGQSLELTRGELNRIRQWTDFTLPFEPIPILDGSEAAAPGKCPRDYNLQQNQELLDVQYMHAQDM